MYSDPARPRQDAQNYIRGSHQGIVCCEGWSAKRLCRVGDVLHEKETKSRTLHNNRKDPCATSFKHLKCRCAEPLSGLVCQLNIVRGRHTEIKEIDIENILKKASLKCQIPSSTGWTFRTLRSSVNHLDGSIKTLSNVRTKQRQLLHAAVVKAPPLQVLYELGEDAVRAFVSVLQGRISRLERDVKQLKKQQSSREPGKVQ